MNMNEKIKRACWSPLRKTRRDGFLAAVDLGHVFKKKQPGWNELKNIAGHLLAISSRAEKPGKTPAALVSYLYF